MQQVAAIQMISGPDLPRQSCKRAGELIADRSRVCAQVCLLLPESFAGFRNPDLRPMWRRKSHARRRFSAFPRRTGRAQVSGWLGGIPLRVSQGKRQWRLSGV